MKVKKIRMKVAECRKYTKSSRTVALFGFVYFCENQVKIENHGIRTHEHSPFYANEYSYQQRTTMPDQANVTASSGTAISTDFATLTCSEILSKILIRCVTWH